MAMKAKRGERGFFFVIQDVILVAIKSAVVLAILYVVMAFVSWDGHRGLWHIDNALGVDYLTKSWAAITGKADDIWDKAVENADENVNKGKREIQDLHGKQQDELDSYDKKTLDNFLDRKK